VNILKREIPCVLPDEQHTEDDIDEMEIVEEIRQEDEEEAKKIASSGNAQHS